MNYNDYEETRGKGSIIIGQAGSGKTTLLCKMVKEATNPLVLSFTNKAVENVKERLIKEDYDEDQAKSICFTFDSYFCEWNGRDIKSLKDKTILIEEYAMVPNKWISKIYQAFTLFNITVHLFGADSQCEESHVHYKYNFSPSIKQMCPNTINLKYIESSCRYDKKKTHDILQRFLKEGKLTKKNINPIDDSLYKNICYLNSTGIKINNDCCNRFTKDKKHMFVEFKYNNKKESYKICKHMPIIATTNLKDNNIFNTMEFTIKDIDKENKEFLVDNKWFQYNDFRESFIPSFCVTVYKYQGADIKEHYNIHDTNRMDKKQLYTALSRKTKFEYIHINNQEINPVYFNRRQPLLELKNSIVYT